MNYVVAAYAITVLLVGGYAVSVFARRRAAERAETTRPPRDEA